MTEDDPVRCRVCGMMNPPVAIFCSNCNRPMTAPEAKPEPQTTEERIEAHLASIRSMMAFFVTLVVISIGIGIIALATTQG